MPKCITDEVVILMKKNSDKNKRKWWWLINVLFEKAVLRWKKAVVIFEGVNFKNVFFEEATLKKIFWGKSFGNVLFKESIKVLRLIVLSIKHSLFLRMSIRLKA